MKIKSLFVTGVAAATLAMGAASVQAESLKIAVVESLSGAQTSTGRLFLQATQYVVDQMNAEGGFNGQPIEIKEYDNAGGAPGATEKFRQAVADGAHIVLQGASSAIAGQLIEDVRKHNMRNRGEEILYLNAGAEAMELTGEKCHFHHIRFGSPAPMRVNALVKAMADANVLGKSVYSMNQNYSWGRDMENAIKDASSIGGYKVTESVLHEVNRIQDFAPFVAKIKSAAPDSVLTGNWSNDLLLLMKATGEAGLDVTFGTIFLDQPGNIGNAGSTALGHYVAHGYNAEAATDNLAENYNKATGHYPVYIEPQTVFGMNLLRESLKTLDFGGKDINVDDIVTAMRNTKIETSHGPFYVRPEDNQVIKAVVISKVTKDAKYKVDDTDMGFTPLQIIPGEAAVYPAQSSCKMKVPS